jgi:ferredoxin
MNEIKVDAEKCCAYGNCVVEAPTVFALREDEDKVVILQPFFSTIPPTVYKAIRSCPVQALTINKDADVADSSMVG